ncbi:MAG: hypothetical protein M0021_08655 [Clostridia bacterium]|nr:hypothetical protein [Clostridia bacterium]
MELSSEFYQEFCSTKDWEELGLREAWRRVQPWSWLGKKAKAAFQPFRPGQEQEWQQEMDLTLYLQERLALQPESLPELGWLFSELPSMDNVIALARSGGTLDDTHLYEVKKFLYLIDRLGAKFAVLGWEQVRQQILEPSGLYRLSAIRERFYGAGEQGYHFYLEDRYSPELADLRSRLQLLTNRLGHLSEAAVAQASLELGFTVAGNGPLVVDREDQAKMGRLEGHSGFVPVEENVASVTWRRRLTGEETCLLREIELLQAEVKLEEERVRRELSAEVLQWGDQLLEVGKWLGYLDLNLAKARLAIEIAGKPPKLDESGLVIKKGVNFLLAGHLKRQGRVYVPLDLEIPKGVTVITGANMGGKTVTLQTVGLLVGMAHLGLPVPAEELVFPLEQFLYSNLGLECSPGLSSFGTEISSLAEILPRCTGGGILLLDEPARGTNPEEGYALVAALIEYLQARPVRVVLTTHFPGLAALAGIAHYRVRGLSQRDGLTQGQEIWEVFDYRLEKVESQESAQAREALKVAGWMGLPEEIIVRAEAIVNPNGKLPVKRTEAVSTIEGGGFRGEVKAESGVGEQVPGSGREDCTGDPEVY